MGRGVLVVCEIDITKFILPGQFSAHNGDSESLKKLVSLKKIDFKSAQLIDSEVNIDTSEIANFKRYLNNSDHENPVELKRGKINFIDITILIKKILRMKIFLKYKKRSPKNYNELINLSNYVRLKTRTLCI